MGVLPGVRVRTTLWLTSGLVSSQPSAAAAANTLLTPGMMDAATPGDEILRARSGADEFDECFHEIASLWNVNT